MKRRLAWVVPAVLAAVAASAEEPADGARPGQAGGRPRPPRGRGGGLRLRRARAPGDDPQRWEALVRLGVARRDAGDAEGSADAFEEAFRTYGKDPEALRFLLAGGGQRAARAGALGGGVEAGDARRGPARSRASGGARHVAGRPVRPVPVLGHADGPRLPGRRPPGRLPAVRRHLGPERGRAAGCPRAGSPIARDGVPWDEVLERDAGPERVRRPPRGQRALDRPARGGRREAVVHGSADQLRVRGQGPRRGAARDRGSRSRERRGGPRASGATSPSSSTRCPGTRPSTCSRA